MTDAKPDLSTIGGRMRHLRAVRRLTQDQVAERCGVPQTSLSRWERGEADPAIDVVAKLAAIGSCTLDWLVNGTGPAPSVEAA